MNEQEKKAFIKLLYKYGTDLHKIQKDKMLKKYTVNQLYQAYKEVISQMSDAIPHKGGAKRIKQIRDIFQIPGNNFSIECIVSTPQRGMNVKKIIEIPDYNSKMFKLLKDYEFQLRKKLSFIYSVYEKMEIVEKSNGIEKSVSTTPFKKVEINTSSNPKKKSNIDVSSALKKSRF
ncbi:hypothetical protein TCON_2207 [Astathelohania contejeani]|uniref:Uncharacterized protein n=1 Tax=Astathelohania contejeani TaxID=164912 RepID=A0ABQ7HWM5_9MICR|nr:hypothetical protein TCON_2207 [Thelohania contejeani]